jgi:hypothetical protein
LGFHSDADHLKPGITTSARAGFGQILPSSSRCNDHLEHPTPNSPTGAPSGTAGQIRPPRNEHTDDGVVSDSVVDTFPWGIHSDADHLKPGETTTSARARFGQVLPSSSRKNCHLAHPTQNSPTRVSSGTAAQISPGLNEHARDVVDSADPKEKSSGQDTDNSRASMGM